MTIQANEKHQHIERNSINPKELRMGNLVRLSGSGKEFIWTLESFYEHYITPDKAYYYEPILLTPDVLLKCGFEKSIQDGMETYSTSISKEHSYLDWHDDGSVLFRNDRDLVDCSADIKYLHQLQNLYFALTGTELNYQP